MLSGEELVVITFTKVERINAIANGLYYSINLLIVRRKRLSISSQAWSFGELGERWYRSLNQLAKPVTSAVAVLNGEQRTVGT